MRIIYKYPLQTIGDQIIKMPKGAILLHLVEQNGAIYLWAEVEPKEVLEKRQFRIYGTGYSIDSTGKEYIGSVVMTNSLVWHVYEQIE